MDQRQYGCLPAKVDVRDYILCSANIRTEYPNNFVLDNLPRVKDQKNISSCCAHATSSILEYYAHNKFSLSTNFIYGIQRQYCGRIGKGMYLTDALKIANKYGDMLEEDCDGNSEIPDCWIQAEDAIRNEVKLSTAYKFRINSYYLCSSDDDIKFALMNYGPVLGAIDWHPKYTIDGNGVITFDPREEGGGHAVMIVGWNVYGWIIQNSWGDKFGLNGRFILPYKYKFLETRAVIDEDNDNELNDLVLFKPTRGPILDVLYKFCNWALNLFS